MGFKDTIFFLINEALLTKLSRRLIKERDAMWENVLKAIHFKDSDPLQH